MTQLNTCQDCGDTIESVNKKDFCNSFCRWRSATRAQNSSRRNDENESTVLSFFEDVII